MVQLLNNHLLLINSVHNKVLGTTEDHIEFVYFKWHSELPIEKYKDFNTSI